MSCLLRKLPALLLTTLLLGTGFQTASHADEIADLNAKARAAYQLNQYDTSIAYYNKLIQLNAPDAYYNRGVVFYRKHKYDIALSDLNESIKRVPSADAFAVRGDIYSRLKNHAKAEADYTEAIKLNPNIGTTYEARAEQYMFLNSVDAALIDCHTAILLMSDSESNSVVLGKAYYVEGVEYETKGDFKKAFSSYSSSIQFHSENYLSYVGRGLLFVFMTNYQAAIDDYKMAIQIKTNSLSANNRLGWLLATCPDEKYRNGTNALKYAMSACDLSSWTDPICLNTYAAAQAETGNFSDAIKWQTKSIEFNLDGKELENARDRLELYRQKKPFRETRPWK